MTTLATPPGPADARRARTPERKLRRQFLDRLIVSASGGAGLLMLLLLCVMDVVLFHGAWPAMQRFGLHFLFSTNWDPQNDTFTALPAIWGTLFSSFFALLIAVPMSIGCAVFLVRIAPKWLVNPVAFLVEVLAAIPSITYGLWGMAVLVPLLQKYVIPIISRTAGQWNWWLVSKNEWGVETYFPANIFATGGAGTGILAASIILAVMIIPIITAVTRDVLNAVPKDLEQGAYGLGATWWQATKVVLSFARSGIFGAVVLGLARAIGETMAVAMVIGNETDFTGTIVGPSNTMTSLLANKLREIPQGGMPVYHDSLIYIALILLVLTLTVNFTARFLVERTTRKLARR